MNRQKKGGRIREFIESEFRELSGGAILLRSGIVLAVSVVAAFAFALFSSANPNMELPKTAALRAANSRWKTRMEMLEYRMDQCEEVLLAMEDRNDGVYREMFGLGKAPQPVYPSEGKYSSLYGTGVPADALKLLMRMDSLCLRVVNQSEALDQSAPFAKRVGALATSIPSIPPIVPRKNSYVITSPFGSRIDPVYGDVRFHHGVDFSTRLGSPVYATGDGFVEIAEQQYFGYGNMVMVNHGYGYKTRYAHLNRMFVTAGQTVHRGELIGLVGRTGKATGTHLHYEVSQRGNSVDPLNFMDLSMSVEDYKEMLSANTQGK